jgi:hypothetical protein
MRSLRAAKAMSAAGAPVPLRLAAVVQALEAVGVCLAAALAAADLAAGQTYQRSSGVALIVLELIVAAGLAALASGLARSRPWSRTPAVMAQVLTGVIGIFLLQAGRYEWGVPALVLALAGLAGLFAPASLKALSRR